MIPGSQSHQNVAYGRSRSSPLRRLFSLALIIGALTFVAVNRQGLIRLRQLQQSQDSLSLKIAALNDRTTELQTERAHLEVDLAYIEQLAREKYRMVYRGEKIFRVVPRPAANSFPDSPDAP